MRRRTCGTSEPVRTASRDVVLTSTSSISDVKTLTTVLRDLEDLLLLNKPSLRPTAQAPGKRLAGPATSDPYNRSRYYRYASHPTKAFDELYAFCFALAKPPYVRTTHCRCHDADGCY